MLLQDQFRSCLIFNDEKKDLLKRHWRAEHAIPCAVSKGPRQTELKKDGEAVEEKNVMIVNYTTIITFHLYEYNNMLFRSTYLKYANDNS